MRYIVILSKTEGYFKKKETGALVLLSTKE
jgi:hypothetical protein